MRSVILFVSLIALALASYDDHTVLFNREGVPANSGWNVLRKAEQAQQVKFTIALQQQNLAELEARFWANADPKSPVYAQHMSREEVAQLTAASPRAQKSVLRWIYTIANSLPKGHLFEVDNQLDAIVVTSTAAFAEKLFKTEMMLFQNERNNIIVCKHTGFISIPTELMEHIVYVSGITELEPIKLKSPRVENNVQIAARQTADNQCNNPYTIKNLYNVPSNIAITNKNSNASIYAETSYKGYDGFGLASIEDYQNALGLPSNPITCILGTDEKGYLLNDTDTEANLDTEMMTGMAPGVDACFYLMEAGNGWMYEFSRYIFNTPEAPLVVSMSYGWFETDQCYNTTNQESFVGNCTYYNIPNSKTYVNLTNVNFMKLGLVGHTLIAASGDDGASGGQGSDNNCVTLGPTFPAASPYVTVVGATSIEQSADPKPHSAKSGQPALCTNSFYGCVCSTSNNEQIAQQNNTAQFDSGGGFSAYSAQPAYQTAAVKAYLAAGLDYPTKYFNPNNRGYPDMAAVGEQVCLLDPQSPCNFVGGTSAAAPLVGALLSLLNNDRLVAGKTPLGFFNPVIYDMFAADSDKYFNNKFDSANNYGSCPEDMGYPSKSGLWSPIVGVGSPNFGNIRAYVATLK